MSCFSVELLRASAAPSGQPSSVCPRDGLENSVDSSGELQPDPARAFPRASPRIPWPSNACVVLGLLADKKTVNIMLNPLPEGLNVITKMEAHLRKEVAELEKLALDMYSVATEIKEIISNAESLKTVTEFQSQIVAMEGKPLLEHVE